MRTWAVDPGIREMIEYFDEPQRYARWDLLRPREREAIINEIRKCRESFEYAARNYFWIVDKQRREVNFRLWEAQELILDKLYELKRRGRAQKLMILKARQLGCSTLIEALIAWRAMFFENIEALVVSVDRSHSAYLFSIMLHIFDRMPWWLKPEVASRKYEEGLWFANPNADERRIRPGLNSRVIVQAANQYSGIGQGRRLNAAHISEGADWDQRVHRMTMEGDLQYALADNPETFAVWESTAKGAGTYTEQLWLANVRLGERADWYPLFLPWFFEKTRVMAPPAGWRPEQEEIDMRERVSNDWVICDNPECRTIRQNHPLKGVTLCGATCPACQTGTMEPYILSDEQLCWIWHQRINKQRKGADALKDLKAEMCSTPQEAFQIHGLHVFPKQCWDFVNTTIRAPLSVGDFDAKGNYHGINPQTGRCYQPWCESNHEELDMGPVEIWEFPKPGEIYVIGVDVSEGLGGDSDYSVAFVNKVGRYGEPDEQVAMYRSNTIDPMSFAYPVTWLGYMYNTAMLSIEYNGIGRLCADTVRINLQYPNLYRWKHPDSDNIESTKWHWMTQYNTKPKLWQCATRWLRSRMWLIRSSLFYEEMIRFQKEDYDSKSAEAEVGWHDDVVMAGMIALYTAHETDYEENSALAAAALSPSPSRPKMATWKMTCTSCEHTWTSERGPEEGFCPRCSSIRIFGTRTQAEDSVPVPSLDSMENMEDENEEVPDYAQL